MHWRFLPIHQMQCGFKPLNKIKLVEDPKNSISYNQIFTENFCHFVQADYFTSRVITWHSNGFMLWIKRSFDSLQTLVNKISKPFPWIHHSRSKSWYNSMALSPSTSCLQTESGQILGSTDLTVPALDFIISIVMIGQAAVLLVRLWNLGSFD